MANVSYEIVHAWSWSLTDHSKSCSTWTVITVRAESPCPNVATMIGSSMRLDILTLRDADVMLDGRCLDYVQAV